VASPGVQMRAVQLTSFDPNNWTDVLQLALANATDISDHWSPTPAPALQQVLVNQVGYPGAIGWSGVGNPLDALASLF
jgi:hypothetical protein